MISSINSILDRQALGDFVKDIYHLPDPIYCELMKKGFNDHYSIRTRDNLYVLRVYSKISYWDRSPDELRFEVELLKYLDENGIAVSRPIQTQEGNLLTSIETAEGKRYGFLMDYLKSQSYEYTEETSYKSGQLLARMHQVACKFKYPAFRVKIDQNYLLDKPLKLLQNYQPIFAIDGFPEVIEETIDYLKPKIESLNLQNGLIHGDYGPHNLLLVGNKFHIFDFDICGYGPYAFDIGCYFQFTDEELQPSFLQGYQSIQQLSKDDIDFANITYQFIRNIWILGYWLTYLPVLGKEYFPGAIDTTLVRLVDITKERLHAIRNK